ncbi:MAG: PhoU domain-containing protein [Arenicellales bacterium WSBS_2016_MAG_OTU3]
MALACASRESLRMADKVDQMLRRFMDVLQNNDAKLLRETRKQDDQIDALHEAIKLYLTEVSRNELDKASSRRCLELIHVYDQKTLNTLAISLIKICWMWQSKKFRTSWTSPSKAGTS